MAKKIEIKVAINCQTCKSDVLKAVTKLTGIDQISVNDEKGILTVIGDVDPVSVMEKLKKINKSAQIMTVGPPKPPEPKKPDSPVFVPLPHFSQDCHYFDVGYYQDTDRGCCIL